MKCWPRRLVKIYAGGEEYGHFGFEIKNAGSAQPIVELDL